jgi:hypothetical protein
VTTTNQTGDVETRSVSVDHAIVLRGHPTDPGKKIVLHEEKVYVLTLLEFE